MVITPNLRLFTTFERKGWLKTDVKSCCWRFKGGRRTLLTIWRPPLNRQQQLFTSRTYAEIFSLLRVCSGLLSNRPYPWTIWCVLTLPVALMRDIATIGQPWSVISAQPYIDI